MTQPEFVQPASTPAVDKASVWEDFVDILYAPAQVFRRRIDGNWFAPMVVVTLSTFAVNFFSYGALRPMWDAEFDRQMRGAMRANPQLTPDMMETGRKFGEFAGHYGALIFIPILIVAVAFIMWLVGKAFGSKQTFGSAMMVAGYSQVPRVLGAIAMGVQALLLDPAKMTGVQALAIGPARFFDQDATSTTLFWLMSRLDVFTIWATILIGVGLHVTGMLSKAQAAMAAFGTWLVAGLYPLWGMVKAKAMGA